MMYTFLNVLAMTVGVSLVSTMHEVAARAGVSVQTVSNVINDRAQMSESTRRRVQSAIESLGYVPNHHARGLRKRANQMLAFIVVDPAERFLADEFHDVVLAGISDALRDRNYCLLIQQVLNPQAPLHELMPLAEARVDGAIVTGSLHLHEASASAASNKARRRRQASSPMVFLEQEADDPAACSIIAENRGGGVALATHLVERGRRRFAFVRGLGNWPSVESRLDGIQDALGAHGLRCDLVVSSAWAPEDAYQAVLPLLHAHPDLDTIVAANDVLALGAMKAVRATGRRVPDDVAVTGFDDFAFSRCLEPALTTVKVPGYEMGRTAAEMILACLSDGSFPQRRICFPTTLVIRDSS